MKQNVQGCSVPEKEDLLLKGGAELIIDSYAVNPKTDTHHVQWVLSSKSYDYASSLCGKSFSHNCDPGKASDVLTRTPRILS